MTSENGEQKKTTEGTLIPITDQQIWENGHSPLDVLNATVEELDSILDIIVVCKYKKENMPDGERFMVSMSDQSLSNKLGMLELAKVICLKHGQEEEYFE